MSMSANRESQIETAPDASKCVARSVAEALKSEPALEAVTIDRSQQMVSIATLGRANVPQLQQTLTVRLQKAFESGGRTPCQLLEGKADCDTCDLPLSRQELEKITIENHGNATTIARV